MTDHWMPSPQISGLIWLTGLSGSGKSTLADALKASLDSLKIRSCILDGDVLRSGLNKDLGFGPRDRQENIRRAGEVSKLLAHTGWIVLATFISPYRSDPDWNHHAYFVDSIKNMDSAI